MENELKQLIKQEGEKITITSVDLCKLINVLRKEEKGEEAKELLHNTLMRSIRNEIELLYNAGISLYNFVQSTYINDRGKVCPCYILNDKGMLQILNKESAFVRYKTTELIEELKEENSRLQQQLQNQKPQLTLEQELVWNLYNGGIDAVTAHKKLLELETKELNDKIVEQQETIETHLETIEDQQQEIKQLSPLAETLIKRFEKGENISLTDVTKTFGLKRGQVSKWAINNGYIYKNKKDVTNKGDSYFQRYVINGFKNICITPQGVQLIEQHLEEIKLL